MMRASGGAALMLSRAAGFAVFRQIGFEQVALGLGFAFERAQLNVLLACLRGDLLGLIEIGRERHSRSPATLASLSSWRSSRSPSIWIWRSISAICALSSLMRGCWSSSVVDCSASCARTAMRCSISRRMVSELAISAESIGLPERIMVTQLARPRLQVGLLSARRRDLRIDLGKLLARQRRVVGAGEQIGARAIFLDLGFGVCDLRAHLLDFAGEPDARGARLFLLRGLLRAKVRLSDCVGDACGEIGIGRAEIDGDDARLLDRIDVDAVVVGFQRPLFARHRAQIAADAKNPEDRSQARKSDRPRDRIPDYRRAFLSLMTSPREIARKHELDLAGHGFRIDGRALAGLVGFGAQEHVFARFQQQPRFGLVARRDRVDDEEGRPRCKNVRPRIVTFRRQSALPSPRISGSPSAISARTVGAGVVADFGFLRNSITRYSGYGTHTEATMARESKRPSLKPNLISPDYGCYDVNYACNDRGHAFVNHVAP